MTLKLVIYTCCKSIIKGDKKFSCKNIHKCRDGAVSH